MSDGAGDKFELVFDGPDVESGTMSARDVSEVLNGLSRTFSTVASEHGYGDQFRLRFADVRKASFHLFFEVVSFVKENPVLTASLAALATPAVTAASNLTSGAYRVVTDIGKLIDAKRKARGGRIATMPTQFVDSEVRVVAPEALIILTREQYELLLAQRVDQQLAKVVSPLAPSKVTTFLMRRGKTELARVDAGQRDYFDYHEVTEEKTREGSEITGTLNSLTKTNLRGTFYTSEGVHVPYRYSGSDIDLLMKGFSAREPVKIRGKVKYGNDGVPFSIEIQDIESIQRSLIQ